MQRSSKKLWCRAGAARSGLVVGALALLAGAGQAVAQPLRMDYCVEPLGGGLYQYNFTLTLEDLGGTWTPGMGWGWVIFGDARRVSPLTGVIIDPSSFPIGPWTSLSSSGGGHNGPTLGPVLNRWIPSAVGESLQWQATATSFVDAPVLTFSTLSHEGGAQPHNWVVANRLDCGAALGACCRADGSCILVSEAGCLAEGGVFNGAGTDCGSVNCTQPATGACCRTNGCAIVTANDCASTGGSYQGDGTTCATAGCTPPPAHALTPPDFVAPNQVWAFNPSHSQVLSGGFRATGFRLTAHAEQGIEAFQSDLLMELVPPNGQSLLIGGDGGNPLVPGSIRWASLLTSGTRPAANGNPASFDGQYTWDFGQVDGQWTVNFWNNWTTTGEVTWNNVMIEFLDLPTGACCMPDATCTDTARGNCAANGGVYQGDGSTCGGAGCQMFLATNTTPRFGISTAGAGQFLDLTAGPEDLTVIQFDYAANVAAGQPTTLEVWTFNGSYVGNDASQTGWTLHDTLFGTSTGQGVMIHSPLNVPLDISAGQTVGVYLIAQQGGLRNETGTNLFSDANLTIFSNLQRNEPWAGTTATRVFGGRVYYELGGGACYANCDGSTVEPILNVDDFTCFINEFAAAQGLPHEQQVQHYANCDGSTVAPALNVDDFTCFINEFAAGCP